LTFDIFRRTQGRRARFAPELDPFGVPQDSPVGYDVIQPSGFLEDGSVSLATFASGIRPVAIVDTLPVLPDADYPPGSLVFLTTDGKVYRNVADVWTAEVAAADGGIEPVAVLPTLPDADYPASSVVILTTNGKIYRNVADVWVTAIDGADILADTITANQIAAGTITADEIAANTITADEIAANAITSSELAADSVIAGKVQAGAISTTELAAGDITLFDADGTTALSPDGFGGAWRRFIQSGMYNSDYATEPPTVGSDLGAGNQMPYWPFTSVGTGSIVARSVTQSSDKAVRFIASSGTNGDQAYIEQIIELASSEKSLSRASIQFSISGVAFGSGVDPHLWVDWLDSGGGVISAALSASLFTWIDTTPNGGYWDLGAFPAGAVFVRVRFGVRRTATNANTGTLYLHEARIAWAGPALRFMDSTGDQTTFPTLGWVGMEFGRLALKSEASGGQSEIRIHNTDNGGVERISLMADDDVLIATPLLRLGPSFWPDARLEFDGLLDTGSTAFPTSPTAGDQYFRTDLNWWFVWNGTSWVSVQLYRQDFVGPVTAMSATSTAVNRAGMPFGGTYGLLIVESQVNFFVASGGTALGASHKWVGTIVRDTGGLLATVNIDSGSSNAWRRDVQGLAAVYASTFFEHAVTWTKTGTPGNLIAHTAITYRVIAT